MIFLKGRVTLTLLALSTACTSGAARGHEPLDGTAEPNALSSDVALETPAPVERCQDSRRNAGEQCDDGNLTDDDLCRADCTFGPCDPRGTRSFDLHCADQPLLLDPGASSYGLLPWSRQGAVAYNPYSNEDLRDGRARAQAMAQSRRMLLDPILLLYGTSFEGLPAASRVRGRVPTANDSAAAPLLDDCAQGGTPSLSADGRWISEPTSESDCRARYNACGQVWGDPSTQDSTSAAWLRDTPELLARELVWTRDQGGLARDEDAFRPALALMSDLEGACFSDLLDYSSTPRARASAQTVYRRMHEVLAQGAQHGQLTGVAPSAAVGAYGVPAGPDYVASYGSNGTSLLDGNPRIGYWGDRCALFGGEGPFAPNQLSMATVGQGYVHPGDALPWLYFTGEDLRTHPAYAALAPTDAATLSAQITPQLRREFFDYFWDAQSFADAHRARFEQALHWPGGYDSLAGSTASKTINRMADQLGSNILYPAVYASAGALHVALGDPSVNEWNRNRIGFGAPMFAGQIPSSNADAYPLFAQLVALDLVSAEIKTRVSVEIAMMWKHYASLRVAPIWTPFASLGGATARVVRDPTSVLGETLCTTDVTRPGDDPLLPNRCGPPHTSCTIEGESEAMVNASVWPLHPGRTRVFRRWDAARAQYVDAREDPEANTWLARGTELFVHQTVTELLRSQIEPIFLAAESRDVDALVSWPETLGLKNLCAGQAHRLKYGGGFHHDVAWCCGPGSGVPEALWTLYFAPGPLSEWCHSSPAHEASCSAPYQAHASCGAGQTCEPQWSTLDDAELEQVCTEAVDQYVLTRWNAVRQTVLSAGVGASTRRPTQFCSYLNEWFAQHFGAVLDPALCQ